MSDAMRAAELRALLERLRSLQAKAAPGPWKRSARFGTVYSGKPTENKRGILAMKPEQHVFVIEDNDGAITRERFRANVALMCEAVSALDELLAAVEAVGWRSTIEEPPPRDERLWVAYWVNDKWCVNVGWHESDSREWWLKSGHWQALGGTFWMPIPPLPKPPTEALAGRDAAGEVE